MPPDSSSSETGKETPPETVHFIVGEGSEENIKQSTSREKSNMVRSYSQDTNMTLNDSERPTHSTFLSKTSLSDNSLDSTEKYAQRHEKVKKSLRELPTVMSVDDETLSTDSNSTADNDELKRRRRKLPFAPFRKSKSKYTWLTWLNAIYNCGTSTMTSPRQQIILFTSCFFNEEQNLSLFCLFNLHEMLLVSVSPSAWSLAIIIIHL